LKVFYFGAFEHVRFELRNVVANYPFPCSGWADWLAGAGGPVTLTGNEQFVTAECHVHRLTANLDCRLLSE